MLTINKRNINFCNLIGYCVNDYKKKEGKELRYFDGLKNYIENSIKDNDYKSYVANSAKLLQRLIETQAKANKQDFVLNCRLYNDDISILFKYDNAISRYKIMFLN